jgi:hypothetical protein
MQRAHRDIPQGSGSWASYFLSLEEIVSQFTRSSSTNSARTDKYSIYDEAIPFVARLSNHERDCDTVFNGKNVSPKGEGSSRSANKVQKRLHRRRKLLE